MHCRETDKDNTQPKDKKREKGEIKKESARNREGGKGETRREKVVTKELGCELSIQNS